MRIFTIRISNYKVEKNIDIFITITFMTKKRTKNLFEPFQLRHPTNKPHESN